MNIFKDPDYLHQSAFQKARTFEKDAPWHTKDGAELLKKGATAISATDNADEIKSIQSQFNHSYHASILTNIFSYTLIIVGVLPPAIYKVEHINVLSKLGIPISMTVFVIVLVAAGIGLSFLHDFYKKKCDTLGKQDIILTRLKKWFDVTYYTYNNTGIKNNDVASELLYNLKIADNAYQDIVYTDYFQAIYQKTSFIFWDCSLYQMVGRVPFPTFKGQILVIKLDSVPTDTKFCVRTMIEKNPEKDSSDNSEIFNHPMISEQINLWGTDEQASNQDSSEIHRDDIHDPKFNQSADMDNPGKDLMEKNASILRSIQQIANCDAGFVLSNNYLAVILANDFDPFEVKRKDIKKSDAFIDTIDAQAGWLQSIINEVKKTGWIS